MAKRKKNKQSQLQNGGGGGRQAKRQRDNTYNDGGDGHGKFEAARGYVDPSTGQRGAFPGLENYDEDFYGPPQDGLDYLRMVRSEAKGVPALLLSAETTAKAPPPHERPAPPPPPADSDDVVLDYDDPPPPEEEPPEDKHCLFTESTYISLHRMPPPRAPAPHHGPTVARFLALRSRLVAHPPVPSRPNFFPRYHENRRWRDLVSTTPPRAEWLWALSHWEIVRLVQEFRNWLCWRLRVHNAVRRGVPSCWGVWMWALLLRLDVVMSVEDVSAVRELAKSALRVLTVLREGKCDGDGQEWDGDWDEWDQWDGDDARGEGEQKVVDSSAEDATPTESAGNLGRAEQDVSEEREEGRQEREEGEEQEREEGEEQEPEEGEGQKPGGGEEQEREEGEEFDREDPKETDASPPPPPPEAPKVKFYNLEDTAGMMDMIVSVVADVFGQRDLLVERAALG